MKSQTLKPPSESLNMLLWAGQQHCTCRAEVRGKNGCRHRNNTKSKKHKRIQYAAEREAMLNTTNATAERDQKLSYWSVSWSRSTHVSFNSAVREERRLQVAAALAACDFLLCIYCVWHRFSLGSKFVLLFLAVRFFFFFACTTTIIWFHKGMHEAKNIMTSCSLCTPIPEEFSSLTFWFWWAIYGFQVLFRLSSTVWSLQCCCENRDSLMLHFWFFRWHPDWKGNQQEELVPLLRCIPGQTDVLIHSLNGTKLMTKVADLIRPPALRNQEPCSSEAR